MDEEKKQPATDGTEVQSLTDEQVKAELAKRADTAKELLKDQDKMEQFLARLERKMDLVPIVGGLLSSIPALISLVRAYIRREYTAIPLGSMIAVVGTLLYFLSPIDLIPDAIPGVGYVDDAAVVVGAIRLMRDDINEYKAWREKNGYAVISKEPKKERPKKEKQEKDNRKKGKQEKDTHKKSIHKKRKKTESEKEKTEDSGEQTEETQEKVSGGQS